MDKNSFNIAAKSNCDRSKQPPRFSIHLNWDQRDELDRLSQGMPWATYIKEVIFVQKKRISVRYSDLDRKLLAKLLAVLGKSRLSSNLNQLAKAANSGSLPVNHEVEKAIMDACKAIEWMRSTLMKAMGMNVKPNRDQEKSSYEHQR